MNCLLRQLRWLPLYTLLLTVHTACGQPYYFKHYQVENGLSNNTVYCSIQDKKGFLWFGTKEGLNRFDGYRFKLFKSDNENYNLLKKDFIYCLFADDNDNLWVGTQNGLFRFDYAKECLVRFLDSLPEINDVQMDRQGRLWFRSYTTVCRYNFTTRTLTKFPPDKTIHATALCMSGTGDMWFGSTDGHLKRFDTLTQSFSGPDVFAHSPKMPTCFIKKIYPAGKDAIFIGTTCQGIKLYNITTNTYEDLLIYSADKTTVYVRDITRYSDNEYWFATESGIFIYNTQTRAFTNLKKQFSDPYSLSDNAVYTLCKDQEGGVWAGTFFGGVNYFPKQHTPITKYYPDRSTQTISGSAVREICEDPDGNLWIGTEDAGLNKLNLRTGAFTHFKPTGTPSGIAYHNIHGLLIRGNEVWIGTLDHGLDILDRRTGKVLKHYGSKVNDYTFRNNFIVTMLQTRRGEIYLGSGGGLYRHRPATADFEWLHETPGGEFISCLKEDHTGIIWIGTHTQGLLYYDPLTRHWGRLQNNPADTNSLTINDINAVEEDSRHNMWIATEGGGLCKLDAGRKRITRYTTQHGLPSNFVFKIVEDNNLDLWVTTSKGLVRLDPVTQNMTVYTKANGLLYDQFNYNSGYKDATGKLYFGSIKGMISFRPEDFVASQFVPPVYITGFQVHNKELLINRKQSPLQQSILYTKKITLPYDQSSFSIDFAALSYTSPEITEYKYMMEGLDKNWTCLPTNRKVYFTNLAPGEYRFRITAAINGRWSQEQQLQITISPPFWNTWWARLVYTAIVIALVYTIIQNYHKRSQEKKAKEIYEAKFEFFTNVAHEIRTPLTLIKGPVENLIEKVDELPAIKEDVTMLERNTNRLMTLITQILDFRQTEAKGFSLDFTKVNISALVQDVYTSFQPLAQKRNLQYSLQLPDVPVIAMADEDALNKIISNLFSNAVKYADTLITVQLFPVQKDDEQFKLEISNDGTLIPVTMRERIFEPFYRIRENPKQKGTGIGLTLARSLTQLHQGRLYVKESLMNTFVLCLPLQPILKKK
ncbi:ligand-binding sensor domain-containing protein [Longitalea luteola]|uniref:ligand-binding sensor domain-containing protein n=1 Tax=Longitalea luteola TaxID=2812563 RepID=UPI001A96594D|nr:two-component regulator propeller domain-containing protein [Longitalea luteola]